MNRPALMFAVALLAMPACVSGQAPGGERQALPHPVRVKDLLYARAFTVERPFPTWGRDRAKASSGVLVVVEVDPAYVDPRDAVITPVLYADNAVVIRLNRGNESGRVIGIIPGRIDLTTSPIWFGAPELPERVTAATVQAERARAERSGVRPFSAERINAVRRPPLATPDVATLLRDVAAQLVEQFSPQERELAEVWRLPDATAPKRR